MCAVYIYYVYIYIYREREREYITLKMVHKMINNRAPSYFNVHFLG